MDESKSTSTRFLSADDETIEPFWSVLAKRHPGTEKHISLMLSNQPVALHPEMSIKKLKTSSTRKEASSFLGAAVFYPHCDASVNRGEIGKKEIRSKLP